MEDDGGATFVQLAAPGRPESLDALDVRADGAAAIADGECWMGGFAGLPHLIHGIGQAAGMAGRRMAVIRRESGEIGEPWKE